MHPLGHEKCMKNLSPVVTFFILFVSHVVCLAGVGYKQHMLYRRPIMDSQVQHVYSTRCGFRQPVVHCILPPLCWYTWNLSRTYVNSQPLFQLVTVAWCHLNYAPWLSGQRQHVTYLRVSLSSTRSPREHTVLSLLPYLQISQLPGTHR